MNGTNTALAATKRICVLSYANGLYENGLRRLEDSIKKTGFAGDIVFWYGDDLPPNSPAHTDIPFTFKAYAFEEAKRRGYDAALWIDATGIVIRPLDPIFEKIRRDGYFLPGHFTAPIGEWSSDLTLAEFGITRDEAMHIPEALTFMIGLDFNSTLGNEFYTRFRSLAEKRGAWRGALDDVPFQDTFHNKNMQISKDPRVKGHRHEQTMSSLIAHQLGMTHSAFGNFDLQGYASKGHEYARLIPTDTIVVQNRDIKSPEYLKTLDKYWNKKGAVLRSAFLLACYVRTILKNVKTYIRLARNKQFRDVIRRTGVLSPKNL